MAKPIVDLANQFLIYQTSNGDVKLDVRLQDETIWLNINQMAELFGVDKSGISLHLKIFLNVVSCYETQPLQILQRFNLKATEALTVNWNTLT